MAGGGDVAMQPSSSLSPRYLLDIYSITSTGGRGEKGNAGGWSWAVSLWEQQKVWLGFVEVHSGARPNHRN